jgi:hypothetical protein
MKKIDLNKIYFLSDQFGMRFIKPINFATGWHDEKFLVFYKGEFLSYVLMNPENERGQQKIDYIDNLLNNYRVRDEIFEGIVEVPQQLVDYVSGKTDTIDKKYLDWPFTRYASQNFPVDNFDLHKHRRDCLVRMPEISEIRDWVLEELI